MIDINRTLLCEMRNDRDYYERYTRNRRFLKNKKSFFYGVKGIEFIDRGNVSDPLVHAFGITFNYTYLENSLLETYKEDFPSDTDYSGFANWILKYSDYARDTAKDVIFGLRETCKEEIQSLYKEKFQEPAPDEWIEKLCDKNLGKFTA